MLRAELSEFMAVLDDRLAKKQSSTVGLQLVAKKVRREGAPSDCLPPPDAPHWATRGMCVLINVVYDN